MQFSVPAGNLRTALDSFARQSGRAVVYQADQVATARSRGFRGFASAENALDTILANSGFVARKQSSGAIAIVRGTLPLAAADMNDLEGSGGGEPPISEIVVTASKRTERLIDVPLAVSVVRAEELSRTGAVRLEDYAATAPGVSVSNASVGGGQTQVIIRGISTGIGGNPVTAAYIDNTPITSATQLGSGSFFPDFDPADLERVEFLRGPQGTLYGAASLGGLVKYVTRKPSFDELSGRAEIGFTKADPGNAGALVRARVNAPLGANVATTVSGFYRQDPGFIDNTLTGARDENSARTFGGRAALAFSPGDDLSLQASVLHQNLANDANALIYTDATGQPLSGDLQIARPKGNDFLRTLFTLYDFTADASFGNVQLVSTTSYSVQKIDSAFDYTPLVGALVDSIAGLPTGTFGTPIDTSADTKKFTQELRAQSRGEGFLGWQIGAFYTREKSLIVQEVVPTLTQSGTRVTGQFGLPPLGRASLPGLYREIAGFGNVTLNFTPRLSVTGGLRYGEYKLESVTDFSGLLFGSTLESARSTDNKLTYLLSPLFRASDDLSFYGRVATGYRPGGPNLIANPASFGPDTVTSYEIGAKGDLAGRLLTFDVAAFLIDWNEIQIQQQKIGAGGVPVNFIDNVGQARSKGAEGAIAFRPAAGLTVDFNVSYTDARLSNTTSLGAAGERLPFSSKWAGQLGINYRTYISNDWSAFTGASVRHVGSRLGQFTGSALVPRVQLPAYETIDVNAGIERDGFTVSAFVRNLVDERGYTGAFDFGVFRSVSVLQPRTFGLNLAKEF